MSNWLKIPKIYEHQEIDYDFCRAYPTYFEFMENVVKYTNGLLWVIQIPLASIGYFYYKFKIKQFKSNHPEEFI